MIEIKNISKKMGNKQLYQNFSINIPDQSFVVITGESGCGKTTLLNMIGGIEAINSGEILINGKSVKSYPKRYLFREEIGFLFQNFALVEYMTVKQNLSMVLDKNKANLSIKEVLKKVGLEGMENKKVYQLSGGEQQRVALARLMLKKCNVILADEPTGSLDEKNSAVVMEQLHYLNEQGKTIVMVTHNMKYVKEATMIINL